MPVNSFTILLETWVARAIRSENIDVNNRKDIARKAGLSDSALNQYLKGHKNPKKDSVLSLSRVLKLSDDEIKLLSEAAQEAAEEAQVAKRSVGGIIAVHPGLPDDLINRYIANAARRIWFLDTWIVNPLRYNDAFVRLAEKGHSLSNLSIQVLLLDPESEAAKQRSRDLWFRRKKTKDEEMLVNIVPNMIRSSIAEFKALSQLTEIDIDIRTQKFMPAFTAHIFDNRAFRGQFVHGAQSDVAPHEEIFLEIQGQPTYTGSMILREFEVLWSTTDISYAH